MANRKLSINAFEVQRKLFKEVTGIDSYQHPAAFINFCNYIQNLQINSKLDVIMKHFQIEKVEDLE